MLYTDIHPPELFHSTIVQPDTMDIRRLLRSCTLLLLAIALPLGVASTAHAQPDEIEQAVLPVVDANSGQIQAWLVLEQDPRHFTPTLPAAGQARSNLGLGNRLGTRFGLSIGDQHGALPLWLAHTHRPNDVDVNDLTVFAHKAVGSDTYLSIAGTVTRATLVPYAAAPADLARGWNSKSVAVGGSHGSFSANLIGHVVDSPGQPRWENLGLGVSWHTPWSGKLTVGADNIVTSGRNPFSPRGETREEGTVPYVRYEQEFE